MNIAILGYGIVGGGVHEILRDGKLGIHVKRVLDVRPIAGLEDLLTDNIADILGDPSIHCVVETIGGTHPALSFVTSALRTGKHVVTSNKELVSHALAPLAEGAAMHNVQIRFSASVGGGIPWIENLIRQKRSDTLQAVEGIVNGTTNYILDAMAHGAEFADALGEARRLGYAEADASADLDGIDAQRKCAISAAVAFDTIVEPENIPALGIGAIRKADVDILAQKGLVCKLMMHAFRENASICAYVEPTLLAGETMAAHVPTNHNFIMMEGKNIGRLALFGQGAGRFPTAQNIVQDLMDIDARIVFRARSLQPLPVINCNERHRYYARTNQKNQIHPIRAEDWGDGILTQEVDVAAMHALARKIRQSDPDAFFAGISAT